MSPRAYSSKRIEGGETGRADRVALRDRLRRVPDRVERVGDPTHRLVQVGHLGDAAGVVGDRAVGVESHDQTGHRELRHDRDADAVETVPRDLVGGHDPDGDHDHRERRRLHADGEPLDDVGRVPRLGRARDRLHRPPARARVVLGDRDERERDDEADQRGDVELAEGERALVEGERHGNEADRRQHRGDDDGLVERVHDRAAPADAREPDADHRGDDGDAAERERIERETAGRERRAEEHDRHGGDGVGLEEVGSHAGAVADVVADVVGDHGRVSRVVLGDAGLDLPDEVGADVGGLRVDAAAEPGEDRDERSAEGEADQVVDGVVLRDVEPAREHPVVAGDAEEPEPDDEEARDRAGAERDVQRGRQALLRRLGGADVGANRDVHADEAGRRGEHGADEEADRGAPAELVVEADDEEGGHGDDPDRHVLAAQVRGCALLHRARNLLHPLRACGLLEDPPRQIHPDGDAEKGADEREQDSVVLEEVGHSCNETGRRAGPAAARSPRPGPETAARSFITRER